ncbi:Mu transposase C-terminal domain-containing protein [Leptolyngbya sp. GGD]|uniref:Mu transposase C-terminal domain-containing protein n=1 Tax=Leptolyngbya sp. GGD TaxID=2997907 RepID=UPI00227BE1F8|nr:Mu transposase C-terminal domain-containing protein [Leptolyngbya sp. GGD]MCY6492805.1 Mu transposase C-terminal domain-containing protein [Leptolyngbya sp. GGD]
MDESHVSGLDADLQDFDTVLLSDRAFDTDPSAILIESSDLHKLKFRLIQWLAESPIRKVKTERKQAIAKTLGISTRQVERLLNQYTEARLRETVGIERSDKGHHRIDEYWVNYIREYYEQSLKDKNPPKPADVVREVQRHAVIDLRHEEGDCPHPATVYRILKPLVERHKRKQKIRNPGAGSWLAVETRDGKLLRAIFSNQILQCDHTKLDIRIVDKEHTLLNWRPWLTTVVDTFSSCVIGYHLWHKQPGAHEVTLTLRHAILPKQYPPEYELEQVLNQSNIYGAPLQYFFTDGGKDLSRSKLIQSLGKKLGFQCELRDRPIQGGIVERLFGTINTKVLALLPGYISKEEGGAERAEKEACLTLEDLDLILAVYFFRDYNHEPYPKDSCDTRFERWLKGMGKKLPEPLNERDLDLCLMKAEQRVVQAHGSVYFENLTYRCEELRALQGEYVTLRYDPDHILTLYAYRQAPGEDETEEFIGFAHAINMDRQDLSLEELKQLNKLRSNAKREHSNYGGLLALDQRQKLAEQRKQEKKERQRAEQKKLRGKSKQNSKIVELRKERAGTAAPNNESLELLPERVTSEQMKPPSPVSPSQPVEPAASTPSPEERHSIVISKNQSLRRIW